METRTAVREQAKTADAFETQLASFMRVHARPVDRQPQTPRFSAKLALQRAFVAAPTD